MAASQGRALNCVRALVSFLAPSSRAIQPASGGLTNAQVLTLRLFEESTELTVNEIAARTRTTQSTASLVIARLARAGLVSRRASAEDARRIHVRLTTLGSDTIRDVPPSPAMALASGIATLSDPDIVAIERGIDALLVAMTDEPTAGTELVTQKVSKRRLERKP